jgi:hypothetical protein
LMISYSGQSISGTRVRMIDCAQSNQSALNILKLRDGNGYKPTRFSLLRSISMKEKSSHRVTYLVS